METISLHCFGVGDGWPSADRNHSAFLYRFGTTAILLDCGEPISRNYKASGLGYDLIDHLVLSHFHADHIGGFLMLMQSFWLQGRTRPLQIHLPPEGIVPLRQLLSVATIFEEALNFRLAFKALQQNRAVKLGSVRVTPFQTSHLDVFRSEFRKKYRLPFNAFCFLFDSQGRRIGHSADLGRPEDLAPLVRKPLDLLVCELAHFEPEELFAFLAGKPIKHIVFVHLGERFWNNLKSLRRLAAKSLSGVRIDFARDGQEFNF
jgi:ribonuclease BN (tRNA processing enzyme)